MLALTKKMKSSNKYPDIQQKHFMKISKWIIDDAKKDTNREKVDEKVKERSMVIADNPDKYIKKFRDQKLEDNKETNKETTTSNSQSNKRNSRSDSRWNDIDYTWKSQKSWEEDRVKNTAGSKKNRTGMW